MGKLLVDVDERTLAKAAARLGTKTKKDTIGKALALAAAESPSGADARASWEAWADQVADRLSEVDWDRAWR